MTKTQPQPLKYIYNLFNNPLNIETIEISGYKSNKCNLVDSLIAINQLPDASLDMILTDPPFGIKHGKVKTSNYNRKEEGVMVGYKEIEQKDYEAFCQKWITPCYDKLKKTGTMIIISGWSNQEFILTAARRAGFYLTSQIVWKTNFNVFTTKKMVSAHYNCFVFTKHKSKYTYNKALWYPEDVFESEEPWVDILSIKKEYWKNKIKTPNKLPKELIEMLVCFYSNNKDLVCDPFSGSGTILKVCDYMKRNCIAFEIVPEYVDFANYRLKELDY
jgi:DNA modification methylase